MAIFIVFYIGLVLLIAWSALRHRQPGWVSGLILAILLATLPLWIVGGIRLYSNFAPQPAPNSAEIVAD